MQRYQIIHRTYYNFSAAVKLGIHTLRLRPKENHELRIETLKLEINPTPKHLRWYRDVEDNSVAVMSFDASTARLGIESEVVIQQYNQTPLDFWLDDYAANYPFAYSAADEVLLLPYLRGSEFADETGLTAWLETVWQAGERVQTYSLLQRLNLHIHQSMIYQVREEPGVQSVTETLSRGSGSCRDFAYLFMVAARRWGFAVRFVSGYLHAQPSALNFGATHAWAEVYLPGAGWKGFDPTAGEMAGSAHFPVAVARLPEAVPPIAGSFIGSASATMDVGVWVRAL